MLTLALASLLASAVMCWVIGHAVVAPRESLLRRKSGTWLLIAGGLSLVSLPPQVAVLDNMTSSLGPDVGAVLESFAWPSSIPKTGYIVVWILTSAVALLGGMQIWNVGKPGWRPGSSPTAYDTSAAGRARALIPLADSLDDVFDAISRAGVDVAGVARIADDVRAAGAHLASALPESPGAAYQLAAAKLSPAVAAAVTRFLLEGAGRGAQIARMR